MVLLAEAETENSGFQSWKLSSTGSEIQMAWFDIVWDILKYL
jgi:hypothetical protein